MSLNINLRTDRIYLNEHQNERLDLQRSINVCYVPIRWIHVVGCTAYCRQNRCRHDMSYVTGWTSTKPVIEFSHTACSSSCALVSLLHASRIARMQVLHEFCTINH